MQVEIDGVQYQFYWKHHSTHPKCPTCGKNRNSRRRFTECFVTYGEKKDPVLVGPYNSPLIGTAWCHPEDRYVKEEGRKVSLGVAAVKLADKLLWDKGITQDMANRAVFREEIKAKIRAAYHTRPGLKSS